MGVGLYLQGQYGTKFDPARRQARPFLHRIEQWFERNGEPFLAARMGRNHAGKPTLFIRLHPASEEVEITLPRPGRIIVSARTSTLGPGYHIGLCDQIRQLGEFVGIEWNQPEEDEEGDEAGYFYSGDRSAVVDEMRNWLGAVARVILEQMDEGETTGLMMCMSVGRSYPGQGPVLTPLGPRDRAWFEAVVVNPETGEDFWAWRQPGLGAEFYRGRALSKMWETVRWAPPLDLDEWSELQDIHLDLCQAYDLDPTLNYPWREWAELMRLVRDYNGVLEMLNEDVEALVNERAGQVSAGPLIGYRRGPVEVSLLSGWRITVPGAMRERWEKEGWNAWDQKRSIWFTCWEMTRRDGGQPTAESILESRELPEGEKLDFEQEDMLGRGVFRPLEEDNKTTWNLLAFSAIEGQLALCSIAIETPGERDWAVSIWHSLEHTGPDSEDEE